jgi:hypothetical protein
MERVILTPPTTSAHTHAGGANVPALNDLLAPFTISLGDSIIHGTVSLAGELTVGWLGGWLVGGSWELSAPHGIVCLIVN